MSWAKGSKKAVLGGDDIRLPSLQAPDAAGQPVPYWVRFIGDPKDWPGKLGCAQDVQRTAPSWCRYHLPPSCVWSADMAVVEASALAFCAYLLIACSTVMAGVLLVTSAVVDSVVSPSAGVSLDINFEVIVVPGPAASWSVQIVDYRKGAAAAAAAAAGKAIEADGAADLSRVPCGEPFYLEIEALDACHNR